MANVLPESPVIGYKVFDLKKQVNKLVFYVKKCDQAPVVYIYDLFKFVFCCIYFILAN